MRDREKVKRHKAKASIRLFTFALCLLTFAFSTSCAIDERRGGIPAEAQATIDRVTEDIAAGRDEKIYEEAAEEWRRAVTPEENGEILARVRSLGRVESRAYHTGVERQYGGDQIDGHTLHLRYETTFERNTGMETFTLVERGGRWLLARYSINAEKPK